MRLQGKVALLTGAAAAIKGELMGFGGAAAHLFVREGAKVVLTDIRDDLGERAKREGLANLKPVQATAGEARLPAKVDLVLLVDVYHHIETRERYFQRLAASLRPEARVAVIDFRLDSPEGPPKAARIAPERVKAELARAGYALVEEHGFLPRQYFLVFRPR